MLAKRDVSPGRILAGACAAVVWLALAACESGSMFQKEPGPWDGRWAGRMLFSAGEAGCVRRGAMRVEIAGGDLTGTIRGSGTDFGVRGQVLETGELYKGMLTRHNQPAAELTGQFDADKFDGRWKDDEGRCRGTVSLRRVSR